MDAGGLTDPDLTVLPATAEECRALVASSIDRAVEERCVLRSEFLDLTFELDSRATVLEAIAPTRAETNPGLPPANDRAARLPVTGARVVQTLDGPERYKVVLEHVGGARSEHPVASVAEGEAMIRAASSPPGAGLSGLRQSPAPHKPRANLRLV